GGLDDRKCALQGLVVVAGHLGDDERRVVRSNPAPGDLEGRWRAHGVILLRYRFETTSKPLPANSRCETALSVSTSASTKRRSEEHTSELQSRENLVCRLLLE